MTISAPGVDRDLEARGKSRSTALWAVEGVPGGGDR